MLYSLIGFILTILLVISVHEYGHLLMARLCGVRILRYSIGFGRPLWRWVSPRTSIEYVLAMIPLGGYVQLHGQSDIPEPRPTTPPQEPSATQEQGATTTDSSAPPHDSTTANSTPTANSTTAPTANSDGLAGNNASSAGSSASISSADSNSNNASSAGGAIDGNAGGNVAGAGNAGGAIDGAGNAGAGNAGGVAADVGAGAYARAPLSADSYAAKPVPQRMLIAVGGPLFNFILSGVLLLILAVAGFGHYRPILNPAPDSSLYTQGVRAGDVIVSIDDSPVRFRRDIATTAIAPIIEDAEVTITVLRPASNEELQATLRHPTSTDSTRFLTEVLAKEIKFLGPPAIVGNIRAGFPAAESSLRLGDVVVDVDGNPVSDFGDLVYMVRERPNQTLTLIVERDDQRLTMSVPTAATPGDASVGMLGVGLDDSHPDYISWADSVRAHPTWAEVPGIALGELWDLFALTWRSVIWLITGSVGIDNLKGPIGIADYAGNSLEYGVLPFLHFIALISVSIGVLNLLPIPVLDGGHILLLACEGVRGRPVPVAVETWLTWAGIALVGSLVVITVFNDIYALL